MLAGIGAPETGASLCGKERRQAGRYLGDFRAAAGRAFTVHPQRLRLERAVGRANANAKNSEERNAAKETKRAEVLARAGVAGGKSYSAKVRAEVKRC